jgi:hypothetical protein
VARGATHVLVRAACMLSAKTRQLNRSSRQINLLHVMWNVSGRHWLREATSSGYLLAEKSLEILLERRAILISHLTGRARMSR